MWKINGICETGRSFRRLLSSVPPPKKSPVLIQIARLFRRSRSVKVAAAFLLLYKWSVQMTLCTGPSMEPTIHNGDIILVNKLVNLYDTYKHGDIVICVSPSDPGTLLCKRIMGLPGDTLIGPDFGSQNVPEKTVWLQGDNYSVSLDSRSYGPVPLNLLKGRAVFNFNKCKILV